jgi:hypothetical protein
LVSLPPIYSALTAMGGVIDREYVRFGDWPLQILPDSDELIAEAIRQAVPSGVRGDADPCLSSGAFVRYRVAYRQEQGLSSRQDVS